MYKKLIALGAIATLAALALAADGVILKRTPKVGEELKYKLTAAFDVKTPGAASITADVSGIVTDKVLKVEPNGDFNFQSYEGALKIEVAGQVIDSDPAPAKVYFCHPDMSIVDIRGEGMNNGFWRVVNIAGVRFSSTAVKVGDSWTSNIPADLKREYPKVNATYKVLGEEKIGSIDTWKISGSIKEGEGETPGGSEGNYWVNKTDGSLVKEDLIFTNVPIPAAPAPVNGKYMLTLVQ